MPIVIGGDDPGSFGYNDLTVDFYLIYMAWGLDLYDLKVIANNSIKYSMIPEEIRVQGYKKFEQEWNNFINSIFENVCKSNSYLNFNIKRLKIIGLLPEYGPADESNQIIVYGHGFDKFFVKLKLILFLIFNFKRLQIKEHWHQIQSPTTNQET